MTNVLRVLHVEDELDIREVVDFALEDEGFELTQCASGQEALNAAPKLKPDVILLDVMMPGMDGPETLKALRQVPGYEKIVVLFMTAKVQANEVDRLTAVGAQGVITKPFDPMTLADQMRKVLKDVNNG